MDGGSFVSCSDFSFGAVSVVLPHSVVPLDSPFLSEWRGREQALPIKGVGDGCEVPLPVEDDTACVIVFDVGVVAVKEPCVVVECGFECVDEGLEVTHVVPFRCGVPPPYASSIGRVNPLLRAQTFRHTRPLRCAIFAARPAVSPKSWGSVEIGGCAPTRIV